MLSSSWPVSVNVVLSLSRPCSSSCKSVIVDEVSGKTCNVKHLNQIEENFTRKIFYTEDTKYNIQLPVQCGKLLRGHHWHKVVDAIAHAEQFLNRHSSRQQSHIPLITAPLYVTPERVMYIPWYQVQCMSLKSCWCFSRNYL